MSDMHNTGGCRVRCWGLAAVIGVLIFVMAMGLAHYSTEAALLLGLLAASLSGYAIWTMGQIGKELQEITHEDIPLTRKTTEITLHQLEQAILLEQILRGNGIDNGFRRVFLRQIGGNGQALDPELRLERSGQILEPVFAPGGQSEVPAIRGKFARQSLADSR